MTGIEEDRNISADANAPPTPQQAVDRVLLFDFKTSDLTVSYSSPDKVRTNQTGR
jgi:hypothetical protein